MRNAVTAGFWGVSCRRTRKTAIPLFLGSWLLWSCFAFSAGCGGPQGPDRGAVSGTVKIDGELISDGQINFQPSDKKSGVTAGAAIKQGKYTISRNEGPTLGEYKIEIYAKKKTGKQIPVVPPAISASGFVDETEEVVPDQFNVKTTLTKTIKSGINTFDFDLKTK